MHTIDVLAIAFSYIRFSTPEQRKGDSLRRQTKFAADWCQRNRNKVKLDTSLTLHDLGASAFTGEHRSNPDRYALASFLELVRKGNKKIPKGSYLIVEALDRLTREDIQPALMLVLGLLQAGIRIVQLTPVEVIYTDKSTAHEVMMMIMELGRGHSESKMKSVRLGSAWAEKRAAAREGRPQPKTRAAVVGGMTILTHCLPAWIEERDGKPVLVPEKVAIIKRIFKLARTRGSKLILRKLLKDNVPSITEGPWNAEYIRQILNDRRVLGEYQPMKNRGRVKDGDPIPGYFPAVIKDENEWLAVRACIVERRKTRGRTSEKHVNLFHGRLKDAIGGNTYQCTTRPQSHGRGTDDRVLINSDGLKATSKFRTFPYRTFERAVLSMLQEVQSKDLADEDQREADELISLTDEMSGIESRLTELEEELLRGSVPSIANALRKLEAQKAELLVKLNAARERHATPASTAWSEAQSLLASLDNAPDQYETRLRLRALLRRAIDAIHMVVTNRNDIRLAVVQVIFRGGEKYRTFKILHRPHRANKWGRKRGRWWAQADRVSKGPLLASYDLRTKAGLKNHLDMLGGFQPDVDYAEEHNGIYTVVSGEMGTSPTKGITILDNLLRTEEIP